MEFVAITCLAFASSLLIIKPKKLKLILSLVGVGYAIILVIYFAMALHSGHLLPGGNY